MQNREHWAISVTGLNTSEMFSAVVGAPYKANVTDNLRADVVLGVSLMSGWCLSV